MLLSPPSRSSSHYFSTAPSPPHSPTSVRSRLNLITNPSDPFESLDHCTFSPIDDSPISNPLTPSTSKTNAFFASPFPPSPAISPPTSPPPSSQSKTAAFFSSPFTAEPTPPSSATHPPAPYRDTPPPPSRSLTADFFSTTLSSRPTPTPSLRSASSNASLSISHASSPVQTLFPLPFNDVDVQATPTPKQHLPPLARFFPSRYSVNARHLDDQSITPSGFVELEAPADILGVHDERLPREQPAPPSNVFSTGSLIHPDDAESPSYELDSEIGSGAFSHVWMGRALQGDSGLVAVKMIARGSESGRGHKVGRGERASFLREVEVLQRLTPAHPSLPLLHSSFTLRTHHVLVLEYISGGELLDVVNSDDQHARLTEGLLRRIWRELVGAVQWMHSRSVVHRDIKLENILLTMNPFLTVPSGEPPTQTPLIKLTDFGLARIIDTYDPWLSTRCGSESYAAPELLVAAHPTSLDDETGIIAQLSRAPSEHHSNRHRHIPEEDQEQVTDTEKSPRLEGTYDGRETDAWALGVVLFALVARKLPFDPPAEIEFIGSTNSAMLERQERVRRRWVLRVVRGEWKWPEVENISDEQDGRSSPVQADTGHGEDEGLDTTEVSGIALSFIPAVRRLVSRLLVSDPRRRTRVPELWDEPWMAGGSKP